MRFDQTADAIAYPTELPRQKLVQLYAGLDYDVPSVLHRAKFEITVAISSCGTEACEPTLAPTTVNAPKLNMTWETTNAAVFVVPRLDPWPARRMPFAMSFRTQPMTMRVLYLCVLRWIKPATGPMKHSPSVTVARKIVLKDEQRQ